jgi:Tfp pilus assembly protein PilO
MTLQTYLDKRFNTCVEAASRRWPAASLRWRNRQFFATAEARGWRAMVVGSLSMVLVGTGWQMLSGAGWIHSHHVELKQLQLEQTTLQNNVSLLKIKSEALALANEKRKASQLEHQLALDELIVAWPNSALRSQLLHRLQRMAHSQNLRIEQMTLTPLPNEHGFEASILSFFVRGSEVTTASFWKALNQLFQNGNWTALTWRRLTDGHFSLEGQVHLLWDTEDAFTDTGVELQANSRSASEVMVKRNVNNTVNVQKSHLWPDQPLSQMRLVGAAQSLDPLSKDWTWTLLQLGRQIQAVRPGQYLGIENRRVLSLDTQGLWVEGGTGTELNLPLTVLAWEKGLP